MKTDKIILDFLDNSAFFQCSIIGSDESIMEFTIGKHSSYGGSIRECISKFIDGDIKLSIDEEYKRELTEYPHVKWEG